jgi:hypothetical protein
MIETMAQLLTAREFVEAVNRKVGYWPTLNDSVQVLVNAKQMQPTVEEVEAIKYVLEHPFLPVPGSETIPGHGGETLQDIVNAYSRR